MRIAHLVAVSFLVSFFAFAKPKTFKDIMSESETVKKNISSAKTLELKKEELKKWELSIEATLKSYEDENPKEGNAEEDLVGKYSISMEPVFELAKTEFSKESCRKANHQIELEDRNNTKKDPSILSEEAKEALAILNLFCTNK